MAVSPPCDEHRPIILPGLSQSRCSETGSWDGKSEDLRPPETCSNAPIFHPEDLHGRQKLKRIVADLSLGKTMVQEDVLSKAMRPVRRRELGGT
jgi:hypothetical protein